MRNARTGLVCLVSLGRGHCTRSWMIRLVLYLLSSQPLTSGKGAGWGGKAWLSWGVFTMPLNWGKWEYIYTNSPKSGVLRRYDTDIQIKRVSGKKKEEWAHLKKIPYKTHCCRVTLSMPQFGDDCFLVRIFTLFPFYLNRGPFTHFYSWLIHLCFFPFLHYTTS